MTLPCTSCTRPVADQAMLCGVCSDSMRTLIDQLVPLHLDLEVTRTRQSKTGGQGVGFVSGSTVRPLVFDPRASEKADELRLTVVNLVRVVEETASPCASGSMDTMAAYLRRHIETLRHHEAAAEHLADLERITRTGWAVVDRPAEKTYIGLCWAPQPETEPCPEPLYVRSHAAAVICRRCGSEHDVEQRQQWMESETEDALLTATEMSRALSALGRDLKPATLRKWVERERLFPHGSNPQSQALYRVGDVLDLIAPKKETA